MNGRWEKISTKQLPRALRASVRDSWRYSVPGMGAMAYITTTDGQTWDGHLWTRHDGWHGHDQYPTSKRAMERMAEVADGDRTLSLGSLGPLP